MYTGYCNSCGGVGVRVCFCVCACVSVGVMSVIYAGENILGQTVCETLMFQLVLLKQQ